MAYVLTREMKHIKVILFHLMYITHFNITRKIFYQMGKIYVHVSHNTWQGLSEKYVSGLTSTYKGYLTSIASVANKIVNVLKV